MADKVLPLPILACMLLILLPFFCKALPSHLKASGTKPKPFGFLEHLQGCHKGETTKGVHELKRYLKRFGYLEKANVDDDSFDDLLEKAVKTYQLNYHLNSTGILDSETVTKMMKPRCGVPDIINGTTTMRPGEKSHHHNSSSTFHTVAHYTFISGSPRWPDSKSHLTYAFLPNARVSVLSPICARAFARWSSVSHFTFEEIQNYYVADLTIGVYRGDHGDGSPFDGPGGAIAHAFQPTDGRFHYDGDERWATVPTIGAYDVETVALHEIGHLLGLDHSSVEGSLMYPFIPPGVRKDLHDDDIQGIRALYNL